MGQEIDTSKFTSEDFACFMAHLESETALLEQMFAQSKFSSKGPVGGFEVEAWLVDGEGRADPCNDSFLQKLNDPLVVPELASFNFELNIAPGKLQHDVLSRMEEGLTSTWKHCQTTAAAINRQIVMAGILPSMT